MRGRYSLAALWAAALAGGVGWGLAQADNPEASIEFLDVGQGDCTVLRAHGRTVLIDAGPASESYDAGARIVAPKLRRRGVERIDLLILTHPDADHIGGMAGLASRIPISKVVVSEAFRGSPELGAALSRSKLGPGRLTWLRADSIIRSSGLEIAIRLPRGDSEGEDDNDLSLFVRAKVGGLVAVLTGDAGEEAELRQIGGRDWRADVLKAGHHGSGTSTSAPWLRAVHPRAVVASCGRDNRFGHPSPQVIERVRVAKARLFRTDRHGDIRFLARGARIEAIRGR